jgi:RHS repeat-associated protein
VSRHDFRPFGDEISRSGISGYGSDAAIPLKFTSKERDAETGLDFFGARYMSSAQGRFTSPDPLMATPQRILDPQEWNMYAYVRNNPLRLTDPTGLDIWLQGCGADSGTCQGNYVGTTDKDRNFSKPISLEIKLRMPPSGKTESRSLRTAKRTKACGIEIQARRPNVPCSYPVQAILALSTPI